MSKVLYLWHSFTLYNFLNISPLICSHSCHQDICRKNIKYSFTVYEFIFFFSFHLTMNMFQLFLRRSNVWIFSSPFSNSNYLFGRFFQSACIYVCQGWRPRGDWGDVPPKMWGVGTAHASVPPMFWEVVLSDARESTNRVKSRVKKGVIKEFFSEIVVIYDI